MRKFIDLNQLHYFSKETIKANYYHYSVNMFLKNVNNRIYEIKKGYLKKFAKLIIDFNNLCRIELNRKHFSESELADINYLRTFLK